MHIDALTRDANHVHYIVKDDAGNELRQVDRDLTEQELRTISRRHRSVQEVVAMTEGVETAARQPREQASRSVVVHAFEPHEHPYLSALPGHTHDEIKDSEDYLTRRVKDAEDFIGRVQESLRSHGHEVGPHNHPDKPLQEHKHPHTHDDLGRSLEELQGLTARLSTNVAKALTEHDHTEILEKIMSIEGEARTIAGLFASHKHDHDHDEFSEIRGEMASGFRQRDTEIQSINTRIKDHGHALQEHSHPHGHADLKAHVERVETRALELEQADADIRDRLGKVDASHVHQDDRDLITGLSKEIGNLDRRIGLHQHPHQHEDMAVRLAKAEEKIGGHGHDYAEKAHEHKHGHEEIAHLDSLVTRLINDIANCSARLDRLEAAGYLTSLPAHDHHEYLRDLPVHEHPEITQAVEESRKKSEWRELSREQTGGKVRLIVEEVG